MSYLQKCLIHVCRESEPGWDEDIKNDVLEEISKLGSVVHIHVDSTDPEVNQVIFVPSYFAFYSILMKFTLARN